MTILTRLAKCLGVLIRNLGVDFGVDIAGPNLLFSRVTIASLLCTIFT